MTATECTVQFTDKQSARSFFLSKEAITLFVAIRNPLLYQVKAATAEVRTGQGLMECCEVSLWTYFRLTSVVFSPGKRQSETEIYYKHKPVHPTEGPKTDPRQKQGNNTENQMHPMV